ncbi:serine carboxypeptidase II-3-like [Olea europaea subsp. europaea]|uniref:Serine carboxypeptidase II-3-like n=1 Tax=Olea europaea subsp. europaea TaxID=158383 RepID=A0A8S0UCS1_OLEEU|nr:serine carboxypeptidase II-3-like [Olea europaea subsp. europaea]
MQANKIDKLPGQPENVDFDQYAGYITVDTQAGRALFYYFVESPANSSANPLVLWLNGVANVIFLESPAVVAFSYSNTSSDYGALVIEALPMIPILFLSTGSRGFHNTKPRISILLESYAVNYIPQLAYTILLNNKNTNQTVINLKGISVNYFDPCLDSYVEHYLNTAEVQRVLHVNPPTWTGCRDYNWIDMPTTILPIIENLMLEARGSGYTGKSVSGSKSSSNQNMTAGS